MKTFLRSLVQLLLRLTPLWVYRRIMLRDAVGVFYHSISERPLPHVEHLYPSVPLQRFEGALLYLKKSYALVSYQQLHQHVTQGDPLPKRAVHLSFDDGYAECFTLVRPLLLKYGIPCTFFLTTDLIDNRRMFYRNKVSLCIEHVNNLTLAEETVATAFKALNQRLDLSIRTPDDFVTWIKPLVQGDEDLIDQVCSVLALDIPGYLAKQSPYLTRQQIKQMHADGFTIGSHTRSHPKLVQLSPIEMEAEIVASSQIVSEITGAEIVPFSFPNSGTGVERRLLADIRSRHPLLGLFFDTKGIRLDEDFILNRIWAERPAFSGAGKQSNLPALLHNAYADQAWENIAGFRSR